jgi:uncharacterized damage-inducible protein DinB
MKLFGTALLFAAVVSAQETPANPLVATSKAMFEMTKANILRSYDKVTPELWSYKPADSVRSFGQLFAHIADAQYEFCGVITEGKSVSKDVEKNMKTREEIRPALDAAFAYCSNAYAQLTDANAADIVSFFGMKATKLGIMDFNIGHTMEHYGNLVTYMRLKNIVPPSSEPRPPAGKKKSGE